jgi:hypothetical protein
MMTSEWSLGGILKQFGRIQQGICGAQMEWHQTGMEADTIFIQLEHGGDCGLVL